MGKLLDRCQQRTIMAVDNFGRACIIGAIPALYLFGALHLWMVYVLALFNGILSPATEVGCRLIIPRLVPDEVLEKANSLSSISWNFATLVGPALAGILVSLIGAPNVLLLDAASFVLMGTMVLSIPHIQSLRTSMEEVENHKSLLGFGTIFRLKAVRFLTALTLLFLFAQGLAEIAIPVYSQKTLGAGAAGYGLLMSAFGVGSLFALTLISQSLLLIARPELADEREGAEKWPSHVRNFRSKIRKRTGIRTNFRKVSSFAYKLSQYTKGTFPEWWHKSGWFLRWGCQATRELLTEAKGTR